MTADQAKIMSQRVDVQAAAIYARISADMERLNYRHTEAQEQELSELSALIHRSEARIATLGDQVDKSRHELATTSAQYTELARAIPGDIADLSDQLTSILSSAAAEAERIRNDAHDRASEILAEAQKEHETVVAMRACLEEQASQVEAGFASLRQQASHEAADIVREAERTAAELLAQVRLDIEAQQAAAQAKLQELMKVRSIITEQLRDFYIKFNELDQAAEPIGQVRAVTVASHRVRDSERDEAWDARLQQLLPTNLLVPTTADPQLPDETEPR
ncbi:coiled-coil domain-containing protein [Mycolicibacter arupensis]|uniref:Cell division protein DivIVA n=1 Tax=Mycolicibacter arupensis TaxID=342002 RepID=A0A0F5N1I5_9MYCO|nr:hypothetical protein [Mycolicibacter arupensis]KKC00720.1 hypothetical protein WR43_03775 [Mycolicibacter arupensis]MCV7275306.1 hypothetical protein [Mycolicibacter arupensis]ORA00426.1 hypothetical protein BST15_04250 [Mycolicibacter arupensis]